MLDSKIFIIDHLKFIIYSEISLFWNKMNFLNVNHFKFFEISNCLLDIVCRDYSDAILTNKYQSISLN